MKKSKKEPVRDVPSLDKTIVGLSEAELRSILKRQEEEEIEKYIEKLESKGYSVRKIVQKAIS
ncbi:MAG: hypothetical protein ACYS1A_18190 [Planctomycetota bacterium]|jgi:hypothetical protein